MSDDGGGGDADDHGDDTHDRHEKVEHDRKPTSLAFGIGIELDAFPVPDNSFGDVVMSLVMAADATRGHEDRHQRLWVFASFLLYFLSLAGQFLLSYALFATAIEHAEDPYENGRAERMTTRLHDAVRVGTPLDEAEIIVLCDRSDITVIPAYFAMLSIWFLRMVDELAQDMWLLIVTQRVVLDTSLDDDSDDASSEPHIPRDALMSTNSQEGVKSYQIQRTTPRLQRMCLLISIPRLVIALWITWVGAKFLIFAHQTKDLILKTLVCGFFIQVEHQVYQALISEAKQRRLKNTSILFRPVKSEDWSNWGSTVTRIGIVVLCVSVTWFGIFGNIRAFRYACLEYERAFPKVMPDNAGITWMFW